MADFDKSLSNLNESVSIKDDASFLKRLFTFSGPAFMVAVGYMDPGNWATDIAGGSQFGYKLIWVILLSNILAILFQTLSARLGIVTGRDIAQSCRDHYPKYINWILWIICEVAIAATDLAEVLGSALGLYLLFKIPILYGVVITAFDVMLLMLFERFGIRKLEALIITLVATIGLCFAIEMFLSQPLLIEVGKGFIPSPLSSGALFIALGIIGATLMPHNLYLHSALVQTRKIIRTTGGLKQATRFNLIDSVFALNGAFLVNAAILILAGAAFYTTGHQGVTSIIDAHALLEPLLGSDIAPIAFAIALIASGQSSTITGTYAGQIVMEGFIGFRIRPWLRRLITRILAITPAVIVIQITGNKGIDSLLVLSQVILSLQLPFALVPLLHFTNDRSRMKDFASGWWLKILGWLSALLIISLNLKLVFDFISDSLEATGISLILVKYAMIPATAALILLLIWMIGEPWLRMAPLAKLRVSLVPKIDLPPMEKQTPSIRVGIALEVHNMSCDEQILKGALPFISHIKPDIVLLHVVESAAGHFLGQEADDEESKTDTQYLEKISSMFAESGLDCKIRIGTGNPSREILRISCEENLQYIVMGSHGHKLLNDLLYGSTIPEVRHNIGIPVITIPIQA